MNYALYTYQLVDGHAVCKITAYKMEQESEGVNGFHLMTKDEAQAMADAITDSSVTKMVLPLETDFAITAF